MHANLMLLHGFFPLLKLLDEFNSTVPLRADDGTEEQDLDLDVASRNVVLQR